MVDDALLHSFMGNDDDDDYTETISREEVMREFMNNGDLAGLCGADFEEKDASVEHLTQDFQKIMSNGSAVKENLRELHQNQNDKQLRASFAAREINNVNENYFGAYGSFGIH